MSTKLNLNESIDKADDEKVSYLPKASRSVSNHGRTPSATRARSKIPTIVAQNSAADTTKMSATKDPVTSPTSTWGNRRRMTVRSFNSSPKIRASSLQSTNQTLLERQYRNKQNRYLSMRNEIQEKQVSALNMYEEVSQLREKIMAGGGKDPGKIESIKTVAGDFPIKFNDSDNTCRGSGEHAAINSLITKEFMTILQNELKDYPKGCLSLCQDVIKKHSELVDWIEKSTSTLNLTENKSKVDPEFIKQVDDCKNERESFKTRLEMTEKILESSKGELIKKIKVMWEEIENMRSRIRDLETMSNEIVNKMRRKSEADGEKFNQLKETKDVADNDLRKTKATVRELEARIQSDQNKIIKFQEYVKSLETQLKQSDKIFENRTRDLNKSFKNSEETIVSLENQLTVLKATLTELQDKLEKVELERDRAISEAKKRTEEANIDRNKSSQVEELNREIESLTKELISYKDLISDINDNELSSDKDFKRQLEEERTRLSKLTEDYEFLQRTFDTTQTRMVELEDQVASMCNKDLEDQVPKDDWESSELVKENEELGQEIASLKLKNVELESSLAEAINQFEQQDQAVREQAQQIIMQNELIAYLKHKDPEITTDEVSKEISTNAEAIQKLYEMVETKELQLTRLEKLVKQMEDQEERAQEQRTRLERRIAQLELALQTKNSTKDSRYVGLSEFNIYEQVFKAGASQSAGYHDDHQKSQPDVSPYAYNSLIEEQVARTLELERKYQKYKLKSQHIECVYNWLINKSPRLNDNNDNDNNYHSRVYRSRDRYHSRPRLPDIDVGCYAYQVVDNCAREFKKLSSRRHESRAHSPDKFKHKSKSRDYSS
ncbi:putative leucine-rich repeat-containing protein DDB_G0290503 isoform X1 [Microplitis mediator]|uniref:putative leucine-rich repeat-containing protein DDB_G0290503 isoform X1 n=1 Tax=Microplitis mediator TaxID=375433 RepID=UPI002553002D|nr:putative leucine-rich repeat-containing protein DDB_G0290503 isoform X1 [Microplitis mediator]